MAAINFTRTSNEKLMRYKQKWGNHKKRDNGFQKFPRQVTMGKKQWHKRRIRQ